MQCALQEFSELNRVAVPAIGAAFVLTGPLAGRRAAADDAVAALGAVLEQAKNAEAGLKAARGKKNKAA